MPASTRDIARTAVRAQLGEVARELFWQRGFDAVTVNDLAAAAGVSRSTFLRYFETKEEAVLYAFDQQGLDIAAAIRDRPADEDDWTAVRRALDVLLRQYAQDPATSRRMAQLVQSSPGLCAGQLEKHSEWASLAARALAERAPTSRAAGVPDLRIRVRAAAAMACLTVAVDHWVDVDGQADLADLLDQAFEALRSR